VNGVLSFPMGGFGSVDLTDVNEISVLISGSTPARRRSSRTSRRRFRKPRRRLLLSLGLVGFAIRRRSAN
jgi:hypothetical protein